MQVYVLGTNPANWACTEKDPDIVRAEAPELMRHIQEQSFEYDPGRPSSSPLPPTH
jgi:hypothetical protein